MFRTPPKNFFLVVEGPDGSGKSTLIEKLELVYGCQAFHGGGPPKTVTELVHRIEDSPTKSFILDRWAAISEQVYGTLGTRKQLLPNSVLTDAIKVHNPLIIYCRPPFETLVENKKYLNRKKAHKDIEHCKDVDDNFVVIVHKYDKLMSDLRDQGRLVLTYDYTNGEFK